MKLAVATLAMAALAISGAQAKTPRYEKDVAKQRAALEAWTTCIADEKVDETSAVLRLDYREDDYKSDLDQLAQTRVSKRCFAAMPRDYRKIQLGGLPFAGGLAERMIEMDEEPLLTRLSMAAIGGEAPTFSYTDQVAMCTVRGAPHLVAQLFATEIETPEEQQSLSALQAVADFCASDRPKVEASPLAMRSMLATASFRLLDAQKTLTEDDSDA